MKQPIILIHFDRLETNQEEIQRIYDYVTGLGWSECSVSHLPETGKISGYSFCWNSQGEPVFPDKVSYQIYHPEN